jgi:hypothetical protein
MSSNCWILWKADTLTNIVLLSSISLLHDFDIAKMVIQGIQVYTEEQHLNEANDHIKELKSELESTILRLGTRLK